jgi:hypothetical protein
MLPCRKPLAAVAAVTAAFAFAVPAVSASAATTVTVDPQVCALLNPTTGPFAPFGAFGPTMVAGGASLASVLSKAGATVNCPAAKAAPAAAPSLLPFGL